MPAVMATAWCAHPETSPQQCHPHDCCKLGGIATSLTSIVKALGQPLGLTYSSISIGTCLVSPAIIPSHVIFISIFEARLNWGSIHCEINSLWKSSKHPLPLAPFPSMLSTQVNRTVIARVAVFIETHSRVANHFGTSNNEGCVSSPFRRQACSRTLSAIQGFNRFIPMGTSVRSGREVLLLADRPPALVTGVTERRAPINPWWNGSAWLWEVAWYYYLVVGNVNYLLAENIFLASKLVTKKTGALSMCKNYGKSQQRANKYEANSNFIFTS